MGYSKMEKEEFIKKMKAKTKQFAIDTIHFCDKLPKTSSCRTICFQLVKSATSTGANYRAACRGRSKAEFYSKICITVEEADESQYWLEVIEGAKLTCNIKERDRLLKEIGEILAVITKAKDNISKTRKNS